MTAERRAAPLELLYAVLAVVGLVAVLVPAVAVGGDDFLGAVFADPATTTVTLDLLVLGIGVVVFVVVEAFRLGMRRPWLWAVLAVPLPGAFLVPLFLVLRERRLRNPG